ncbi:MAG: glycosyltransferase family 2 protein [Bacteroidota bacterium]
MLNWNGLGLLERFLPKLLPTLGPTAELVVADNASTDDSVAWMRTQYPDVRIIQNSTNLGFADDYNEALKSVDAEYFLLLNSDVEVTTGWLEPLIAAMDADPNLAACQPKILWEKQRDQFEYSGACGGFIDHLGYPFCRGRVFGQLEQDQGQYNEPCNIFWASGACMMVRSAVYNELGGFDPVFFAHMEEIDFCWRMRNAGHNIRCIPESVVYHVGGATLPKNNSRKTFLNFCNNLSMIWKNLPDDRLFRVILLRLVLDGIAGIKFATEGHFKDCIAVIKAHFAFYNRVTTGKLKRSRNILPNHSTIYPKSLVWQHYVRGIDKFSDLKFRN